MTEVLYIEQETRPDAIRQRLARLNSGPVAVVLPHAEGARWGGLDNMARLRLLQRQARILDQDLAIVTQDFGTRKAAQKLGIPVFGNEAAVMGRSWRMHTNLPDVDPADPAAGLPDPPPWRKGVDGSSILKQVDRPSLYRGRQRRIAAEKQYRRPAPLWLRLAGYGLAGLFLAAILGGFVFFVLPAATVTVVPGQRQAEATVQLTAGPGVEAANLVDGVVPARLLEVYIEMSGSTPTSGQDEAATEPASGTIVFTNQTNQAVRIPAGTIVSTSTGARIDFRTLSDAEVAPPRGTRASVAIEALELGAEGNVPANTITTVSGALRTQLQATNPAATGGGQSDEVSVATQNDRDRLLEDLTAQIETAAYDHLLPELREDEWLPRASIETFVMSQDFEPTYNEPAEELNLTLRMLARGVAIEEEVSRQAALQALEQTVPDRAQLVADSLQFVVAPDDVVIDGNTVLFEATSQGSYVIPIDAREVSNSVTGLTREEASALLQERWLLARPPEFYQDPDWFGLLPQVGSRIQVRVEYNEAVNLQ